MDQVQVIDERRDLIVPGDAEATITFCVKQFVMLAHDAIKSQGFFNVALSGGSTPKAIFQKLASAEYASQVDWKKVLLFWGDERSVPPESEDSNFHMAMTAGFEKLPVLPENIFRMKAESHIEEHAKEYDKIVREKLFDGKFDLIMLGMGEDGHTASLFPGTKGLHIEKGIWVIANEVPQKSTWRMSLTYECINHARCIAIYVIGKSKADMVKDVLTGAYDPERLPIQKIGVQGHKALWILDADAAKELKKKQ